MSFVTAPFVATDSASTGSFRALGATTNFKLATSRTRQP